MKHRVGDDEVSRTLITHDSNTVLLGDCREQRLRSQMLKPSPPISSTNPNLTMTTPGYRMCEVPDVKDTNCQE